MTQPQNNSATTSSQPEGQPGEAKQLLAGKYTDEKELEKGYMHQMGETSRIIAERDALKRQLEVVMPLIQSGNAPDRGNAPGVGAASSPIEALAEALNVDVKLLASAVDEIASARVTPIIAGISAHQTVAQEDPDFVRFNTEVSQFLATHPEIGDRTRKMGSADPAGAMKYALLEYKQSRSQTAEPATDATGTNALNAKLDAQLPTGAGNRTVGAATGTAVNRALEQAQKSGNKGDWTEYLAAVLGDDTQR